MFSDVIKSALSLKESQRAELAVKLLQSLDSPAEQDKQQQLKEIAQRVDGYEAGQGDSISHKDLCFEAMAVLNASRHR